MLALARKACSPARRPPVQWTRARLVRGWTPARLETRVQPPSIALPSARSTRASARPSAADVSLAPARLGAGGHGRSVAEPRRSGLAWHSTWPARSARRDAPSHGHSPIARTVRCSRRRASARAPSSRRASIDRLWLREPGRRCLRLRGHPGRFARPRRCAPPVGATTRAGIRPCSGRRHHRFGSRTLWNLPPRGGWRSAVLDRRST